jgi:hypothetical protein
MIKNSLLLMLYFLTIGCLQTATFTRNEDPFVNIKKGMTKQEVLALVGEPDSISRKKDMSYQPTYDQLIETWNYNREYKSLFGSDQLYLNTSRGYSGGYKKLINTELIFINNTVNQVLIDNKDRTDPY